MRPSLLSETGGLQCLLAASLAPGIVGDTLLGWRITEQGPRGPPLAPCMCTGTHTLCTHVHSCIGTHTHTHRYTHRHVYTHMHIPHMCVYTPCVYIHAYIYIYIYMYTSTTHTKEIFFTFEKKGGGRREHWPW